MIASHLIFSAHGFWLPNDPRGSWSTWVDRYRLFLVGGPATKTAERRSLANVAHDRDTRLRAKIALTYPPVRLTREQATLVCRAIRAAVAESGYRVFALAILPDHVHAVVDRHANRPQRIVGHWKARSTQALLTAGLHPFAEAVSPKGRVPQVWAHQAWTVYLDTPVAVRRAIRYVEGNPVRAGLRRQHYTFLTPYAG